jgi:serine/threonine protein phosphatase 1
MRTLAIGDIHGCDTALATLLHVVQPETGDRLVFLGDYIDRGPGSRQVIDKLLEQTEQCQTVFLRGNHEVMILEARVDPLKASLWQSYGGLDTLASYGAEFRQDWAAAIPRTHWAFLEKTVRYFESADHIFVHACLDPELEMKDQPDRLIFWEFLDQMRPHKSGKRIICGHSPQRSGLVKDLGIAVCIDTGAVASGWLTCFDVDSGRYWQADQQGRTRESVIRTKASF